GELNLDRAVRLLHRWGPTDVVAEVGRGLVVVRQPLFGPVIVADDHVMCAERLCAEEVTALHFPLLVIAKLRTAAAAEERSVASAAIECVTNRRTFGKAGRVRWEGRCLTAEPDECKVLLRPVAFNEEIVG